jgi:hypothetical protein
MKRAPALHPLLYAVYPILAVLSVNLGEVRVADVVRPLLVSVAGTVGLVLVLRLAFGDWRRAAIVASGVLILFYAYGHVYTILKTWRIGDFVVGRHRYLGPSALLISLWWLWWGSRKRRALSPLELFFAVTGIVGLLLPLYSMARFALATRRSAWESARVRIESAIVLDAPDPVEAPDIYYIILDAYARADVLRDFYSYDNSGFLGFLADTGFYVAEGSHSNYGRTDLSLASAMNMQYLDVLAEEMGRSPQSSLPFAEMIAHSRIREALAEVGYTFVAFDTGVAYTSLEDADVYISPNLPSFLPRRLTEFEAVLLRSTALRIVLDGYLQSRNNARSPDLALAEQHRERVLLTLDTLAEVPRWDGRYFVYAHLAIPHPPFVFHNSGEPRALAREFSLLDGEGYAGPADEYAEGYVAQLEFLNQRLREILPRMIEESETPPVIILQGDHGPRLHTVWENSQETNMREGLGILNAFFMPAGGENLLYPGISSVNTFRVLLDGYFGADLELLDDDAFFLVELGPFLYDKVTDRLQTD